MAKLTKPFRGEQNQRFSKQLFLEPWRELPIEGRIGEPPFSLYPNDRGLIHFGAEYVRDMDPSGYTTSMRLLGEFAYWNHLLKARWFREALDQWNEEMDAKIYAASLDKIREIAKGDDAKALNAAKYLANKEYKRTSTARGRPSNAEIEGKLEQEASKVAEIAADADRIRLVK